MNKMWIKYQVKSCIPLMALFAMAGTARAQYYYKDIVVTGQISGRYQALKAARVTGITVTPYDRNNPITEGVSLQQTVYPSQNLLETYTKATDATESWLKSYYNDKGLLWRVVDSASDIVTRTVYEYDASGNISSITSNSVPKDNPAETEVHLWKYDAKGVPRKMLKIKNGNDTTYVSFTPDEQGNAGEEKAVRNNGNLGTYYYYYDAQHHLTDIARYNKRADKILPDYMFEYNEAGQLTQMIVVPEASSDYQTWKYSYNQQGLKQLEACYTKRKELMGRVEYSYQ